MVVSIQPTSDRESPYQHNIHSNELESSYSSDHMHIVEFSAIGLAGMGNLMASLESNVVAAVVLIQPTIGRELPCPLHNIRSQLHGPVPIPACMSYPFIGPVGWVGSNFPSQP